MNKAYYLLLLFGLMIPGLAQGQDLTFECAETDTVACLAAVPAPDAAGVVVSTSCPVDINGNPVDTTSNGGRPGGTNPAGDSCSVASDGCYTVRVIDFVRESNGATRYSIRVDYLALAGCKHDISHIAFGMPAGTSATDFNKSDTYKGRLMAYAVENTTNNPYYSIKFNSTRDGFGLGTYEIFTFTLPAGAAYDTPNIPVLIKAGRVINRMNLSVACATGDNRTSTTGGPDSTATAVLVEWEYDYVLPGGTGCYDDPIVIERGYIATDGCANTAFCFQKIVVAGPCVDGAPISCSTGGTNGGDETPTGLVSLSTTIERSASGDQLVIAFDGYEEGNTGRYRISKVKRLRPGTESFERPQLLGAVGFLGQHEYRFSHESIAFGDSILVEWEGPMAVSGVRQPLAGSVSSLRLFPNPGRDVLNVNFVSDITAGDQLRVTDIHGRVLAVLPLSVGQVSAHEMPATDWSAGTYLVELVRSGLTVERGVWLKRD